MALLNSLYKDSLALFTDLYELTMAYAYWKNGLENHRAVFHLFYRTNPFQGAYTVCAGTQVALEYIEQFRFSDEDLAYLSTLKNPAGHPLLEPAFLDYLKDFSLELDVDGMEEGTIAFPFEPLLRVSGPIIQAQILESVLLTIMNFQTLIATKASRVAYAAGGDEVVEFGMRRAQGLDGAISASRAAYIGGCHSTSNVMAGKLFNIPVMGTHAHSFVMAFEEEKEAFSSFASALPESCIFLIDTFETIRGVKRAIEVANEKKLNMLAVRLDSGDLHKLSLQVRSLLDAAGYEKTKIMATNELTEQIIWDLKHQGAKISLWGVGTNLVTAKDHPALDGVYKLSAVADESGKWQDRLKVSEAVIKTTTPGILQVRRFQDKDFYVGDMLFDEGIGPGHEIIHHTDPGAKKQMDGSLGHKDLLVPLLRGGKSVYTHPSLKEMRAKTEKEFSLFEPSMRRFLNPQSYFSGLEERLFAKKIKMIEEKG